MKLSELIVAVKERNLSKDMLEQYRDALANLSAQMSLEMAEIEKAEAIFLEQSEEPKAVFSQRKWAVTEKGQRQITLKHSLRAIDKLYSSIKSRLYQLY